jgi:hypothetical protein
VLHAIHAPDGGPIAGATVRRVEARSAAELLSLLDQRFSAEGIADQVERWTAFAGESRLPPDPETGGLPFVPGEGRELGRTDGSGTVELEAASIAGAKLLVSVSGSVVSGSVAAGYVPALVELDGTRESRLELSCPLSRAGALRVRLVDAAGEAVPEAWVRIERGGPGVEGAGGARIRPWFDELAWHGPSDEHGEIVVEGLPCDSGLFATAFGELASAPRACWIDARLARSSCELRVTRLGSIRGLVLDRDESPQPGVGIRWLPFRGRTSTGATDDSGEFRLANVAAGRGVLEYGGFGGIGVLATRRTTVEPGETLGLEPLFLLPKLRVTGRVRSRFPFDPALFRVDLRADGRSLQAPVLAADGSFVADLPEGGYSLALQASMTWPREHAALVRSLNVTPASAAEPVELSLDGRIGGLRGALAESVPEGSMLRLIVNPPAGKDGLAGSAFPLVEQELEASSGAFSLAGLLAEDCDVLLELDERHAAWFPSVAIPADGYAELGTVRLDPVRVEGLAHDAAGIALPGATVTFYPSEAFSRRLNPRRAERTGRRRGQFHDRARRREWQALPSQEPGARLELVLLAPTPAQAPARLSRPACASRGR